MLEGAIPDAADGGKSTFYAVTCCIFTASGGLLFGYDIGVSAVPMWNRSKLYAAAKILNGALRPRPYLAQVSHPLPPPRRVIVCSNSQHRVCSEDSLFHRDSKIFDGSLHRFHLFRFARCTVYFGSPYSTCPGHGDSLVCWKCGEPAPPAGPFLSCVSCRAVHPVDSSVDYFQIFGQ